MHKHSLEVRSPHSSPEINIEKNEHLKVENYDKTTQLKKTEPIYFDKWKPNQLNKERRRRGQWHRHACRRTDLPEIYHHTTLIYFAYEAVAGEEKNVWMKMGIADLLLFLFYFILENEFYAII